MNRLDDNLFQPKSEKELPRSVLYQHDWKREGRLVYRCIKCQIKFSIKEYIALSTKAGASITDVDALQIMFNVCVCDVKGLCENSFEEELVRVIGNKIIGD